MSRSSHSHYRVATHVCLDLKTRLISLVYTNIRSRSISLSFSHDAAVHNPPDLLLIFWPIFFIAASSRDPELKARNFRKSVAKATSAVALVNHSLEFKRRSFSGDERVIKPAIAQVETEKRPSWDSAKTDTDRYVTAEANFQKACPDRGQFRPPLLSSSSSLSYSSTECERSVSPLPRPGLRQQESQESPSPPPRHIEQQQTSGILPL